MFRTLSVAMFAFAALTATACHDKRPAEGPMEYSGRKVDGAAESTKNGAQKAGHETKCAAKNAKDDAKDQSRDPECR